MKPRDRLMLWDGAAVIYLDNQYFIRKMHPSKIDLGGIFTIPSDVILDLSHRPTLLEFIHRLAERLAKGRTWAVFHAYDGRVRFYLGDETVDFDGSDDEFLQAWEGA